MSHRLSAVSSDYCSVCQNRLHPSAAAIASGPRRPLAVPFLMTYCQPASTKARLKCQHRMTKGPSRSLETNCVQYELILHCGAGAGLLLLLRASAEQGQISWLKRIRIAEADDAEGIPAPGQGLGLQTSLPKWYLPPHHTGLFNGKLWSVHGHQAWNAIPKNWAKKHLPSGVVLDLAGGT